MACSSPLQGWYSAARSRNGGRAVVFKAARALLDRPVTVGCGDCDDCRLAKASSDATRCMCEVATSSSSCFLTLTYSDSSLYFPWGVPSLRWDDLTLFFKSLRQHLVRAAHKSQGQGRLSGGPGGGTPPPTRVRYYACGEYGDHTQRPHYHVLMFNYWPDDAERHGSSWRSQTLERIWGHGHVDIGFVTMGSALYTARYTSKKQIGNREEWLDREAPFLRMSQSLGRDYALTYKSDYINSDSIAVLGEDGSARVVPTPRTFLKVLEKEDPASFARLRMSRRARVAALQSSDPLEHWYRETARAVITHAKLHLSLRDSL